MSEDEPYCTGQSSTASESEEIELAGEAHGWKRVLLQDEMARESKGLALEQRKSKMPVASGVRSRLQAIPNDDVLLCERSDPEKGSRPADSSDISDGSGDDGLEGESADEDGGETVNGRQPVDSSDISDSSGDDGLVGESADEDGGETGHVSRPADSSDIPDSSGDDGVVGETAAEDGGESGNVHTKKRRNRTLNLSGHEPCSERQLTLTDEVMPEADDGSADDEGPRDVAPVPDGWEIAEWEPSLPVEHFMLWANDKRIVGERRWIQCKGQKHPNPNNRRRYTHEFTVDGDCQSRLRDIKLSPEMDGWALLRRVRTIGTDPTIAQVAGGSTSAPGSSRESPEKERASGGRTCTRKVPNSFCTCLDCRIWFNRRSD